MREIFAETLQRIAGEREGERIFTLDFVSCKKKKSFSGRDMLVFNLGKKKPRESVNYRSLLVAGCDFSASEKFQTHSLFSRSFL